MRIPGTAAASPTRSPSVGRSRAGVGIAVLHARSIADGLVRVPLADAWVDRDLVLATRDVAGLSRPAGALADRIRGDLGS